MCISITQSIYEPISMSVCVCVCMRPDGRDLSDDELETITHSLTRAQAEAVQRRVNILSTTLRRRNKVNKTHVRDIFPGQTGEQAQVRSAPLRKMLCHCLRERGGGGGRGSSRSEEGKKGGEGVE